MFLKYLLSCSKKYMNLRLKFELFEALDLGLEMCLIEKLNVELFFFNLE